MRTADLVIHVRDIAHPESEAQLRGRACPCSKISAWIDLEDDGRLLEFWNKQDLLSSEDEAERMAVAAAARRDDVIFGSATQPAEGSMRSP